MTTWVRSSRCGSSACVEVGLDWVRSTACGNGDCVEVRKAGKVVVVRDGKLGEVSNKQTCAPDEWADLLVAVECGGPVADGWDASYHHPAIDVGTETVALGSLDPDGRHEKLRFTHAEWNAFVAGVLAGEFDFDKLPTPGPSSTALDGSDEVAARCHDAATVTAGEGVYTGMAPSSAVPSPPNGFSSLDSPAGHRVEALDASGCANVSDVGRPGPHHVDAAVDVFWMAAAEHAVNAGHDTLSGDCCVRAALVAAYPLLREDLELKWGSGPLTIHVPEDSSPAGGVPSGEPAARAGDAYVEPVPAFIAAGGEVVPAPETVGVPLAGATEPESHDPAAAGWVANDAAVVESAGPASSRIVGPADSEARWACMQRIHIGPCGPDCIWHTRGAS